MTKVTYAAIGMLVLACGGTVTGSSSGALGDQDGGTDSGVGGSALATGGAAGHTGGHTNETGGAGPGPLPEVNGGTWNYGGAGGRGNYGGTTGDAGHSCVKTDYEAVVAISGHGVDVDGGARTNEVSLQGRVSDSRYSEIAIDSCPALADCAPLVTNISVTAPNLDLSRAIPKGSLVRVHYKSDCPFGCTGGLARPREGITNLAVTSLGEWGGYTNTAPSPSGFYLAVVDGGGSLPEFPFEAVPIHLLDCPEYLVPGCGGPEPGLYAYRFDEPPRTGIQLWMGEPYPRFMGNGTLSLQILRSYQTHLCDDYMNWAYWVANAWD